MEKRGRFRFAARALLLSAAAAGLLTGTGIRPLAVSGREGTSEDGTVSFESEKPDSPEERFLTGSGSSRSENSRPDVTGGYEREPGEEKEENPEGAEETDKTEGTTGTDKTEKAEETEDPEGTQETESLEDGYYQTEDFTTDDGESMIIQRIPLWAYNYIDSAAINAVASDTGQLGDSGRLYIPVLDINVAVYFAHESDGTAAQLIGDAYDSAVYTPHEGGQPYIADHWNQGFAGLRVCQPGTLAYWKHKDRIDVLYCTRYLDGRNDGIYILTEDGENCYFLNEGGLFMYTCKEDWQHVAVTFWQPIATFWN